MLFCPDGTGGSESAEKTEARSFVDDVKVEWRLLWRNRIDDKVRAEGVANRNYSLLFVERGTIIVATRDFKPLSLKEILRLHEVQNSERYVHPHPSVGGWGKFIRTDLNRQNRARKWKRSVPRRKYKNNLQIKKGGRGWLHYRMNR